jgi:hypothetical protein
MRRREFLIGGIATAALMGRAGAQTGSGFYILHNARASAIVRASMGRVDMTTWLYSLTSEDYVRCAPGEHQSATQDKGADGRAIFASVETIGGDLMTHRFVAERSNLYRLLAVSERSEVRSADGTLREMRVSWDLAVHPAERGTCRLTSGILMETADGDLATSWAGRPTGTRDPLEAHCAMETPLFAADLARKARAGRYQPPG